MKFKAFLEIELKQLLLRWRWLGFIPIFAFLSYRMSNFVLNSSLARGLTIGVAGQAAVPFNAWDALFPTYNNAWYTVFVLVNFFLICVCDSLPESKFGSIAVFRLRSRKGWWLAKTLSILILATLYTLAGFLVILLAVSPRLGFSWQWSVFALEADSILVPFAFQKVSTPLSAALTLFGMNVLGLWVFGVLMQLVTLLTRRYLFGYGVAMFTLISSFILSHLLVNVSPFLKILPAIHNFNMNFWPYLYRDLPMRWSYLYWIVWLFILLPLTFRLMKKASF